MALLTDSADIEARVEAAVRQAVQAALAQEEQVAASGPSRKQNGTARN